jgi:hypothetical protein
MPPCAVTWCCALAEVGRDYCRAHRQASRRAVAPPSEAFRFSCCGQQWCTCDTEHHEIVAANPGATRVQ